MRKLTILFALLPLSVGLWAETIDDVHCLGANGEELTIDGVNVVTSSNEVVYWGESGQTTWYVVTGTDVTLSKGAVCQGDVHLILGTKLISTGEDDRAGIQVSGEGNSFTIYQQLGYVGVLEATGGGCGAGIGGNTGNDGSNITINGGAITAIGGNSAAGIGGGYQGSGSNIIINGGDVTATGGFNAAGIGGGENGDGSDITINGGKVTATDGNYGACIGGGNNGSGSNIIMPVDYRIKVGTTFIHNDGTDLANILADKRSVTAYLDEYFNERNAAMTEVNAAVEGIADENILALAAKGIEDIFQNGGGAHGITAAKAKALSDLQNVITIYNSGKAAAKAEAATELLGEMATPCTDCTAVKVSDGETTITLYNATSVDYEVIE